MVYIKKSAKSFKKKRTFRKKVSKVPLAIKSYVKKALHVNIENKVLTSYAANQSINVAVSNVPSWINLMPVVSAGIGSGNRIGDEINVVKAYIRGRINILPYNVTTNPLSPVLVKMWLVSHRRINSNQLTDTDISTTFFTINNGTIGFQGNMLDMIFTPNLDSWKIYKTKSFELGSSSSSGTTGSAGTYFDNSAMTVPFYFEYAKHVGKVKYLNGASVPQNKNLFLVIQVITADGSSSASSIQPAESHFVSRIEFEDA